MARTTYLGMSGTGKSHSLGELLEECLDPDHPNNSGEREVFDTAMHLDLEDEEKGLSDQGSDYPPIYKTLHVTPEIAAKVSWVKVLNNHERVRVVPDLPTLDQVTQLYADMAAGAMKYCKDLDLGTCLVSCDEAHNLLTQSSFPQPVERMITGGRKHGLECIHASQRPQLLHTTLISQADLRVYFHISDDNDLGKINGMSNFDADLLEELPKRVCVAENKHTGDAVIVVKDESMAEYVPDGLAERHGLDVRVEGSSRLRPHYSGDDGIIDDAFPV